MTPAEVTVEMHHVTSNREPYRYTTLTVSDAANRHVIVQVRLTPEQVYDMIAGHIKADRLPAEVIGRVQLANLGKKTNAFSRTFQRDRDNDCIPYGVELNDQPGLNAWAEGVKIKLWAHAWSWYANNNSRIKVTFWRYENDLSDSSKKDIDAALRNSVPPKGLL